MESFMMQKGFYWLIILKKVKQLTRNIIVTFGPIEKKLTNFVALCLFIPMENVEKLNIFGIALYRFKFLMYKMFIIAQKYFKLNLYKQKVEPRVEQKLKGRPE